MITTLLLAMAAAGAAQNFEDSFADVRRAAQAATARPEVIVDEGAIGSWYRKVASTDSVAFDGISATGTLPQPHFDPARMHRPQGDEKPYTAGPLDSPGLYVGAHADRREVDAGFKWDHRYDENGRDTGLFAWRLFWRIAAPSDHSWHNPAPGSAQDIYLNPGDRFALTLAVRPDGTARLDARGGGASATAVFALDGFWNGAQRLPRRFKRVDSVDQFTLDGEGRRVGNEGNLALPTLAALDGGRWDSVVLTGAQRAPLTGRLAVEWRGGDQTDGYDAVFPAAAAGPDAAGAEAIVIRPPHP